MLNFRGVPASRETSLLGISSSCLGPAAQVKEGAVQCCAKRIGSMWMRQLRYLVPLEPKKRTPQVGWGQI